MSHWTAPLSGEKCALHEDLSTWSAFPWPSPLRVVWYPLYSLLQKSSDRWNSMPNNGWPRYLIVPSRLSREQPSDHKLYVPARKPFDHLLYLLLPIVALITHILGFLLCSLILICTLPLFLYTTSKEAFFWYRSLHSHVRLFCWITQRNSQSSLQSAESSSRPQPSVTPTSSSANPPRNPPIRPPWTVCLFDFLLSLLFTWELDSSWSAFLTWQTARRSALIDRFRRYMLDQPPAFNVGAYDLPFFQDSLENPCQIVLMAVTERLDIRKIKRICLERWVKSNIKLRSRPAYKWGVPCWQPLHVLWPSTEAHECGDCTRRYAPSYDSSLDHTSDLISGELDLDSHVTEVRLNLKEISIYEALSDFGTYCLPRNKPLWRIYIYQPMNADVAIRIRRPATTLTSTSSGPNVDKESDEIVQATDVSFLACQIHHSVGDGVAVASSLMRSFFDPLPRASLSAGDATLPPQKSGEPCAPTIIDEPKVTWIAASIFYVFHFVRSLWYMGGNIFFFLIWSPLPPALFQSAQAQKESALEASRSSLVSRPPASGRKFYVPPMLFDIGDVKRLCTHIQQVTTSRPTINDIFSHCIASAIGRLRSGDLTPHLKASLKFDESRQKRDADNVSRTLSFSNENKSQAANAPRCARRSSDDVSRTYSIPLDVTPSRKWTMTQMDRHYLSDSSTNSQTNFSTCMGNAYYHRYATHFETYLPVLIPMSCRLFPPTDLNNLTALVTTRLPTLQATESRMLQEGWGADQTSVAERRLLVSLRNLLAVKGELDWLKEKEMRPIFFVTLYYVMKAFPPFFSEYLLRKANATLQAYFTNVLGPDRPLTLGGRAVWSLQSWPPTNRSVSTGIKLLRYCNDLQLLTTVDENELSCIFTQIEQKDLTRRDLLLLSSVVGELVWDEFQTLHEVVDAYVAAAKA